MVLKSVSSGYENYCFYTNTIVYKIPNPTLSAPDLIKCLFNKFVKFYSMDNICYLTYGLNLDPDYKN